MIEAGALALTLWFGLGTLRAAEAARWWLAGFELAVLAMATAMLARRRFALRFHPLGLVLAGITLWGLAQAALGISVDPHKTLLGALGSAVDCAAFSVALAACGGARARRWFVTSQAVVALGLGVVCIAWLYMAGELGPFAYKNQFAAYLEVGTGIAMARAIGDPKRRLAWIAAAGAMFACAAAAGSRAGAILCLAELIALPAVAAWRGWISRGTLVRMAALGVASAAALVMVTGWETVWQRLQEPNPYAVRAEMLKSSVAMARERPVEGFGLGAWPSAYPGYALYDDGTFVNEAHNDWAQWMVEGGAPLLLAMLAVVALLLKPAAGSLWGLGLIAVFVHAWVDYPFEQRPALAAFFWAMAGALAAEATASARSYRPDESCRA